MNKIPLSLQLYTVRDLLKTDFVGTVNKVGAIGYHGVEMAGWGNLTSITEVRKALDGAGLKVVGAHVGLDGLEKDLNKIVDEARALDNTRLIISSIPEARRKDAAGWKESARAMNKAGGQLKALGFSLGYHNHAFEFTQFDGTYGLDILWENSEPELVKSELDVYWVKYGNVDPVAYLKKLGKRVLSLHLKDMAAGPDRQFAPVGSGILDFKAILAAAATAGAEAYVVEQDSTYGAPTIDAARTSYENLKKLGAV